MKWKWPLRSRCWNPGFTLVETLLVVTILVLTAVLATPSLIAWHVRDQVEARAQALLSTLSYARSEATRRGARVTVCRIDAMRRCLASGQACRPTVADWACGWAVMVERAGAQAVLRAQAELAAVSISGTQTSLTFTPPAGQLIGSFRSFEVAPRFPSKATQGPGWRRCIHIAAGGRARIVQGACSASA
jgi:type IV fimbrial biogenesis protein FimT